MNKIKICALLCAVLMIATAAVSCVSSGDRPVHVLPLGSETDPEVQTVIIYVTVEPQGTDAPPAVDVSTGGDEITDEPSSEVPDTPESSEAVITGHETEPADTAAESTEPRPEVVYEIRDVRTSLGGQSYKQLRYPELSRFGDENIRNKVNTLLSQIAEAEYASHAKGVAELLASGRTVTYEVTRSEVTYIGTELMSVRSEGVYRVSGNADERFIYCNIIDLKTGRDVTEKNTFSNFGILINAFTEGRFTLVSGADGLLASASYAELISPYKDYALYGTYPDVYFTNDSVVIIIELGAALGYYAEFSLPLSAAEGALKVSP